LVDGDKMTSRFLKIKCKNCGEERIVFGNSTKNITCRCGAQLIRSTGSKAKVLNAKVIAVYR